MKKVYLFLGILGLLLGISLSSIAQISREGTPASMQYQLAENISTLNVAPATLDWNIINSEDALAHAQNLPIRAGFSLPANISTGNEGTWETLPDGRKLWRLKIETSSAVSVGLVFDKFHLPEGAELYIYNSSKSFIIGAFTSENNNPDNVFSTHLVPGSAVIIEYIETPANGLHGNNITPVMINGQDAHTKPAITTEVNYQPQGLLHISEIIYAYNDDINEATRDLGDAGTCEVNINCSPEGDNWQDEKRGVARILFKEGASWYYCSGSLVNNTLNNGTPYFLTAYHCGAVASAADHSVWQFYFNYERATCANSGTPPTNMITGCTKLAEGNISGGTDFQLVQLSSTPISAWNIYYNGWDRSGSTTTGGVSIHHPSGDSKKISTFTGTTSNATWFDGTNTGATNGHWTFPLWATTTNGHGVSEGGSSGSSLFNSAGRVIGTLSGGSSDCAGPFTGDLYGKFSIHWQNSVNGTGNAYELRYWLDPALTNPTTLDGMDPNAIASPPVSNFSATPTTVQAGQPVQFTDLSSNLPQAWSWTFASGYPATSTLRNPSVTWVTPGTYTVTLTTSNGYGSDVETKVNYITVTAYTAPTSPVTIGTGTTSGTYWPYGISTQGAGLYTFVRDAAIYTAAEIGGAGVITALSWRPSAAQTDSRNIKIYLKHTSDATFTTAVTDSAIAADATLVYDGTFIPNTGTGYFTHTLQTPFSYNGSSNLMVIVFVTTTGTPGNKASNCYYTTSASRHQQWNDATDPTAVGTINGNRPNLRINISPYTTPVANFAGMSPIMQEDFEGATFPPSGWSVINTDGGGATWAKEASLNHTTGGGASAYHSWGVAGYAETGMLISKKLTLPAGSQYYLTFWNYCEYAPDYVDNALLISTTDSLAASFTTELWSPATVSEAWTMATVDLSTYAGQTIYLAFKYTGTYAHSWALDDVSLSSLAYTQISTYEGDPVTIFDKSTNNPTVWSWQNTGGTPTQQFTKDENLIYYVAGLYPVSLTAGNPAGSNTKTVSNFVNVIGRAPVPDFNGTGNLKDTKLRPFIPAGGTVIYEDLSTRVPTGWSWTFTGGSPASSNVQTPPTISYSTPGEYSTALYVSNLHGNNTGTATNYVVVGGKDTCTNMLASDGLSVYGYTNGLIPGHASDASGKIWKYAEFYDNAYAGTVTGVEFGCYKAQGAAKNVTFYVWDGSTGTPGTVLGSKTVLITSFTESAWNFQTFDTPIPVTGDFFVGYELTYDATHNYTTHQFCTYMTSFRNESVASTAFCNYGAANPGTWYTFEEFFGNAASILLHPEFTYDATGPIVTATATPGCLTGSVTLTSTITSNQTFYLQTGAGAAVANWTGNTNTHTFTGLADGSYKGYTIDGVTTSPTSNTVTLTNSPASAGGTLTGGSTQICIGSNTGLMTVSGYTGAITKWQKSNNGGSTWTDIINTAATYSEVPASAGTWLYRVEVVSGTCTAAYSNNFTIVVDPATVGGSVTSATTQICLGSASGVMTLSGHTGTVVKWQKSNNGGTSWTDIVNTAITYSETPAIAGTWLYRAVVQSGTCATANSASFSLTVNPLSVGGSVSGTITEICLGASTGTLTLTGNTGTITKWQKSNNGGTSWTDITNTNATYTETPASAGTWLYRAVVQSGVCTSANSSSYSITVYPASVGGAVNGTNPEICLGSATGTLTLTGNTGTIVKWQKSNNGGTSWTDIVNTAATYSETPGSAGTWLYRAVVQSGVCSSSNSSSYAVIVDPTTVAGSVSGTSPTICIGSSTGTLTLSGHTGTVVKWQKSNNGGTSWTDITNTLTTYSETPASAGTWLYRAVVQSGVCSQQNSGSYTITVSPASVGGSVTDSSPEICLGSATGTLTLSGYTGTIIKWQKSNNGGTSWTDIANTLATYSETPVSAGTWMYRAVVQSGPCSQANSSSYSVIVDPASVAGTLSGPNTEICRGSSLGTLTLSGYTGTIVRWERSDDGGTSWMDLGNTAATYNEIPGIAGTRKYRVFVKSGVCSEVASNVFTIIIDPVTIGGSVSGTNVEICLGSSTNTLTLGGYTGSIIKWQKSNNGGTSWIDIANTAATYSETPVSSGTWLYRAVVQSGVCTVENSTSYSITVSPASVGGSVSGTTDQICLGSLTGTLTLSGYTGSIVKWQKSNNGGTSWTDIANTAATYSETPASAGVWLYRAQVQSGSCAPAFSASFTITVDPVSAGGTVSTGSTQIYLGDNTGAITLAANVGNIIRWEKRFNAGAWTPIATTANPFNEIPTAVGFWDYRAVVQSGNCTEAYSNFVQIEVLASSAGAVTGGNSPICLNASTGIMTLTGYTGTIIRWQKSNDGGTSWTNITNTADTYSEIPVVAGTWLYRVELFTTVTIYSAPATIVVNPATVGGAVNGGTGICLGLSTGTLTLSGHTGAVVKWQVSNNGGSSWSDIANTLTTYSTTPGSVGTYFYRAIVQSGVCLIDSSTATTVVVSPVTVAGSVTGGSTICAGSSTGTLTLSGHTGSVIKWQVQYNAGGWADIANTLTTFSETLVTAGAYEYRAVIQSGACSQLNSTSTTVTVDPATAGGSVNGPNSNICLGDNTGIMTLSGHTGTIVKWQKSNDGGTIWTDITNTSATYSEVPATAGTWIYRAQLQSGVCSPAFSGSFSVTAGALSVGGSLSGTTTICAGNSTGTMTLTGYTGTIVKWQFSTDGGGTWSDISNTATTWSEVLASAGIYIYRAVVQNGGCAVAYSSTATITVDLAVAGGAVTGPNNNICLNDNTGTMTLAGHSGTVIQWQKSNDSGASWTNITNTSTTYSEFPSVGTWWYRAEIQSGSCGSVFSSSFTVVVNALSAGGTLSGTSSICAGNSTGTMTLTGYTGTIVKWQSSNDGGSSWTDITNTLDTYSEIPAAAGTWQYRVIVQSGICSVAYSTEAVINVDPATVGGAVNGPNSDICLGEPTGTMTLTGSIGSILKWQKRVDAGTWFDITNNTASYGEIPVSAGIWEYRAEVQSGSCVSSFATAFAVNVNALSVGGTLAGAVQICTGSNTGVITLTGYTGAIVKWQRSDDGGSSWNDITNTLDVYSEILTTPGTYQYQVIVQNGTCASAISAIHTITVDPATLAGTLAGSNSTICEGSSTGTMTLTAYTGSIIKWQKRLNGGSWQDIANTADTYDEIPSAIGLWEYQVVVQSGVCNAVNSNIVSVTVSAGTVAGTLSGGNNICESGSIGTLTLTGYSGSVVKWQVSFNGGSWTDIVNTADTWTEVLSIAGTYEYRAEVQSGTCAAGYSSTVVIIVSPLTVPGSMSTMETEVCEGTSTGTVILSGYTGDVVKWQRRIAGGAWTDIANTSATYSEITTAPGLWEYRAEIQSGSCTSAFSTIAGITVLALPVPGFTFVANNLVVDFTNTTTNATSYSWNFGDGTAASTAVNPSHTYTSANTFTVVLTAYNGICSAETSQAVEVLDIGITDASQDVSISFYPNPVHGVLTLSLNGLLTEDVRISITDVLGQVTFTETLMANAPEKTHQIDMSSYATGVYYMNIQSGNHTFVHTIVVK